MMSLPQLHAPPPAEGCGSCTACCVGPALPELGKPFYAACTNLSDRGCDVYSQRPGRCRDYRCAWHLGMLGARVDRRPDKSGILFHFESEAGQWALAVYELWPGAAMPERMLYLRDVILKSKQARHLKMREPAINVYPYGADLAIDFAASERFDYTPPTEPGQMKREVHAMTFVGPCRGVLRPVDRRTP